MKFKPLDSAMPEDSHWLFSYYTEANKFSFLLLNHLEWVFCHLLPRFLGVRIESWSKEMAYD